MWKIIEESTPGFNRNDPSTWSLYHSTGKYGLSMRGPCFHPILVKNRYNPNLVKVLRLLVESNDMMVSHDRYTIYRATGSDIPNGEQFRTGSKNVHLDLNPWWWCESSRELLDGLPTLTYQDEQDFIRENNLVVNSMGIHVQCVLNFEDNTNDDGGTVIVPGFHKHIQQWCDTVPIQQPKGQQNKKKNSNSSTLSTISNEDCVAKQPLPWLHIPSTNSLLNHAQRVPMKAGSVLIWNQTLVHGTSPNNGTNRCRLVQYLKAFNGLQSISLDRMRLRSNSLKRLLSENGADVNSLSEDARKVFGFYYVEEKEDEKVSSSELIT